MKVYGSNAIRNVAFVGHGASGKTSLVDALAFVSGASRRHGSIKDGTTLTDYSPDEIERKHSINLGLGYAEWLDTKINLIDTPGYLDYFGEVVTGLHAADAAVVVLSGTGGVEVGTEKVWEVCDQLHLPRVLFVSLMDKEHADFERVFNDVKTHLTPKVVPVEIPIGDGHDFHGIINLFSGHCHFYKKGTKTGEYDVVPIPPSTRPFSSSTPSSSPRRWPRPTTTLIERYLGGEEIPRDAFHRGDEEGDDRRRDRAALLRQRGADLRHPHPAQEDGRAASPRRPRSSRRRRRRWSAGCSRPSPSRTWATSPCSGSTPARSGTAARSSTPSTRRRRSSTTCRSSRARSGWRWSGSSAGDIGSVAKLKDTHTGDTFCWREAPVRLPPIPFPEAVATSAVVVKQRGEEDKLAAGLHKLHEEDPTFHFEYSSELGQTLIHGMGERHFETILDRLERKFGVHAELARPRVAYRETIKGKAEGQGKHKKQTGGRGQYGDCWIRVAPLPRGAGYEFVDEIVGGVIPEQVHPGGGPGIQEAAVRGVMAGYPLVDFKAECYDGSYHDVDSNEMSFKLAGILAFRNVTPKARPVLLEPLVEVEVWTPDDVLGDVMGDLSSRRGQILGTEQDGRLTKVRAMCPKRSCTSTPPRCTRSPTGGEPTGRSSRIRRGATRGLDEGGGGEPRRTGNW